MSKYEREYSIKSFYPKFDECMRIINVLNCQEHKDYRLTINHLKNMIETE